MALLKAVADYEKHAQELGAPGQMVIITFRMSKNLLHEAIFRDYPEVLEALVAGGLLI